MNLKNTFVNLQVSRNEAEAILTALNYLHLDMQKKSEDIHEIKYADIYNYIREETDKVNNAINASSVVKEVIIVRLKVSLIDKFITSISGLFLYFRKFSRTLSKITTVSFKE